MINKHFSSDKLLEGYKIVKSSPLYIRTPIILFKKIKFDGISVFLKLENMQNTGSFKIRGVINQVAHVENRDRPIVTSSAGNYGKALAYISQKQGLNTTVFMPDTAPRQRATVIKDLGAKVEIVPNSILQSSVDRYAVKHNALPLHPYDDVELICGHASCGMEIMEDNPTTDLVLVCCGGGGLVSGVALALKSKNPDCLIYAVEPRGAPKMFESFRSGKPEKLENIETIASGLAPPYAGALTYEICSELVEGIVLVSDDEIKAAVATCYDGGLVVEPSGAAALAALLFRKIPEISDLTEIAEGDVILSSRRRAQPPGSKEVSNVTVIITGGNVTPGDLEKIVTSADCGQLPRN